MKYKVIKLWPGCPFELNDVINKLDNSDSFMIGIKYCFIPNIENWGEYLQPLQEKIFTTEDGVNVCDPFTTVYHVSDYLTILPFTARSLISSKSVYFYRKNAEKYIHENKKVFSRKDIMKVLSIYSPCDCPQIVTTVLYEIRNELDIND